jgi:hypothetical protein
MDSSTALVEEVDALAPPTEITSREEYRVACQQLGGVQSLRRKVDAHYDELKAPVLVAQRGLIKAKKEVLDRIAPVEKALTSLIITWEDAMGQQAEREIRLLLQAERQGERPPGPFTKDDIPMLAASKVRPEGLQRRTHVKVKVTDMRALARAVADGELPAEYLKPNDSALASRARADGELFSLPGCERVTKAILVTRSEG